jgi:hypothetical protein
MEESVGQLPRHRREPYGNDLQFETQGMHGQ